MSSLVCSVIFMYKCMLSGLLTAVQASEDHLGLNDVRKRGGGDVAAVQFPEPSGPPGGSDDLQGSLVVELAPPVYGQVNCLLLSSVFWSL